MKRKAFTIIELIVTMAIMGTLSATILPRIGGAREEAKNTMSKVDKSRELASYVGFDGYTFSSDSAWGGGGNSIVHDLWNGLIVTHYPEANVSYTLNWNENFTAGLITITDWTKTYTIMDRNLWATSTGIDSSDSYWYYFQWWNNYWFPSDPNASIATSNTQVDASGYWPWNYYSSSTFITGWVDRSSVRNDNLRWWVSGTYEAMQWPCPEWYHVPSSGEWLGLSTMLWYDGIINSDASKQAGNILRNELYFPFAGYRLKSSAGVNYQGTIANYWSSTAYSAAYAYTPSFISDWLRPQGKSYRSDGFSVRCFKN